jgi:G3E family GTPase
VVNLGSARCASSLPSQPQLTAPLAGVAATAAAAAARAAQAAASAAASVSPAPPSFGQLVRSKGHLWLATRPDMRGDWSHAGRVLRVDCGGPWYAAMPQESWPLDEDRCEEVRCCPRDWAQRECECDEPRWGFQQLDQTGTTTASSKPWSDPALV